jgi:uncharacterized protein YodC (DUF2158 family)
MDVKEGDLVVLKSGGVMLTVTGVFDTQIEVAWSDGRHNYQYTYPRSVLWKAELTDLAPAPVGTSDYTH